MEVILRNNDFKGGWTRSSKEWIRARLLGEVGEYFDEVAQGLENPNIPIERQNNELIDIANYCMMLWDRNKNG